MPNNVSYFSYKMKNQPMSNYGPKIVKKGKYFFLEIIRDNSNDSRQKLNSVPFESLIAKMQFIIRDTTIDTEN